MNTKQPSAPPKPSYKKFALIVLGVLAIGSSLSFTIFARGLSPNLYLFQAEAFLHGRTDLGNLNQSDVAEVDGRRYCPFPPFPAVALLPLVALFGMNVNVILVAVAITVLSVELLRRILLKLEVDPPLIPWLLVAFFAGTAYWPCVKASYGVWFFAHVVAIACMFLAINEALGKGRGFLVGLFLGMAVLSRQFSIYALPFLCAALWTNKRYTNETSKGINLFGMLLFLGLCGLAYLWFNYARFGNMFKTGYNDIILPPGLLKNRFTQYGLFSIAYVPFNFVYMFIQGFRLEFAEPLYVKGLGVNAFGTSLTFSSPFVFIALWARWKKPLLWTAWIGVCMAIIHLLFYYNNGWKQPNGPRFALDFMPVLILLVALGAKRIPAVWTKAAVGYALALNVIATALVPLAPYVGL